MEMENLKALLNNCNLQYDFVKCYELEQGKKYEVSVFKYVKTKYGKKVVVILDNKLQVFLPDRFLKEFTKEKIELYNQKSKTKYNLIYNGEKKLNNGKTMHLIDFE